LSGLLGISSRRCADYFVCYLSSHSGCNRGCEFCHLTATGQTSFQPSTINDFTSQALSVFKHYRRQQPARYMHYSFMARGEPLANPHLLEHDRCDLPSAARQPSLAPSRTGDEVK